MVIVFLVSLLLISFLIHLHFIILYALLRQNRDYLGFCYTAILNSILAGSLIFIALKKPHLIHDVDLMVLVWILCGILMVMLLALKISILRRIYRRAQEPENYHRNFFGKKVLHNSVVKPVEIVLFFGSIPFFLFAGAYFVARIINVVLYGHF